MCDIRNDIDCYFNRNKAGNTFSQYQDEINELLLRYVNQDKVISCFVDLYNSRNTCELMTLISQIIAIDTKDLLIEWLRKLQVIDVPTLFYVTTTPYYAEPKVYCVNIGEPAIDSDQILGYQSGQTDAIDDLIETLSMMYMLLLDYKINVGSLRSWIYHCARIEIALATHMYTPGQANDPRNVYHSESADIFFAKHPVWLKILDKHSQIICFTNPNHIELVDKLITLELQPLKLYLIYCVLKRYGMYTEISEIFTKKDPLLPTLTEYFGSTLEQYFDKDHLKHVREIKVMFNEILTQAKVAMPELKPKLDNMLLLVGSQDYQTSMPKLSESFYLSMFAINASSYKQRQALYDKRINRKWLSVESPIYSFQMNAYYEPISNLVYVPTAMLLLWSNNEARNYGGLGSVISHEVVHAFDTYGRLFDSQGTMRNWLDTDVKEIFAKEISKVDSHYKLFRLYGKKLHNENTLSEDIADIIGLKLSLKAYQTKHKLTKDTFEDFMSGWAELMRDNSEPDVIKKLIPLDVHSPGIIRINAPFSHINEYYDLFEVEPTNKGYLAPQARVTLV